MHDPGHSTLGSIVGFTVDAVIVDCDVGCGFGLGLGVDVTTLVLSQQTEPLLQLEVCGISIDGRSQKAAIIFNKQKPGHFGPRSVTGRGR